MTSILEKGGGVFRGIELLLSKAHSLAGFRVGFAVLPEALADDLNSYNDSYPLARPSQAAALATLLHEDKIRDRAVQLRAWAEQLSAELRVLGVHQGATVTPRNVVFDQHHPRYEEWFVNHAAAYYSELLAVRALLPCGGEGLEIGVGTGRFAAPLGVQVGVDPSVAMLEHARMRGIRVVRGVAERLPFAAASFDYGLIVTTLCFVDDPAAMLREARRVIKPDGCLLVGFIDRETSLGQEYLAHQSESLFYRDATFYSAAEVESLLRNCGFPCQVWVQTLSRPLSEVREIEPLQPGRGTGAFVVVRGC